MKRGGPSHPKTFALAEALGIRRAHAVGILELLFHFTAQYCPAGDIGRFEDRRIAAALDWGGAPVKLVDAMVAAGWLDHHPTVRLVVHDWAEHADRTVLQRMKRAGKIMVQPNEQDTAKVCTHIGATSEQKNALPEPEPEPEPEPVFPQTPAAKTAAARVEDEDSFRVAEETFDLSGEERAEANRNPANRANGTPKKSLLSADVETALDVVARRIHARHPAIRRCGISEVKKQLRAIARGATAAKRIDVLHQIDRNHAGWCGSPDWRKDDGQYAKGLDNWLSPTKERWSESPAKPAWGGDDRDENGYPRQMMP